MSNIDFAIKCIQQEIVGLCPGLDIFNTLTGSGAGITDCTVGVVASGATYGSVSEALAMGCRQIRIVGDLSLGPPAGTFVEPLPFTLGAGGPAMIYITPGVNWVLRESVIGVGGVAFAGETLVLRGSGPESLMTIDHDGAGADLFAPTATSNLFLLDMGINSDDSAAGGAFFGAAALVNQVTLNDCQISNTTNTGTGFIIVADQGGSNWDINNCHFVGTAPSTSVRMISAFGFGSFRITNAQFSGEMANAGTSGFAATIGGLSNEAVVNGMTFGDNAAAIDITITNGQYSDIVDGLFSGAGPLNITFGGGASLANSRTHGIIVDGAGNAILSNVSVLNSGGVAWSIVTGMKAVNCYFSGPISITGPDNELVNCEFSGGVLTTTVATIDNQYSNCNFETGSLITLLGAGTQISNCAFDDDVTVSSANNVISGCTIAGTSFTLLGDNNMLSGNSLTAAGASTMTITGGQNSISGLHATAGLVTTMSGALCTRNSIDGMVEESKSAALVMAADIGSQNSVTDSQLGAVTLDGNAVLIGNCTTSNLTVNNTPASVHGAVVDGCQILGTLAVVGINTKITGCHADSTSVTITAVNTKLTGCELLILTLSAPGTQMSNCAVGVAGGPGVTTIDATATGNIISNCSFSTVPVITAGALPLCVGNRGPGGTGLTLNGLNAPVQTGRATLAGGPPSLVVVPAPILPTSQVMITPTVLSGGFAQAVVTPAIGSFTITSSSGLVDATTYGYSAYGASPLVDANSRGNTPS